MIDEIKISIVVPIFNTEKYLRRCLRSILEQTYKNWEVVLVDDGSDDASGNICDGISSVDDRFRTFHKKNEGLGLTRNFGVIHSTGDYVLFIDADDYIEKNALTTLAKWVMEYDCDLVIGNFFYDGRAVENSIDSKLYKGEEINNSIIMRMVGSFPGCKDLLSPSAWGKLYRKSIFIENNIWFPSERVLIWEDLAFNYKYMQKCTSIFLDNEPVYHYCFNVESLTHCYDPRKLDKVMIMYQYMKDEVEKTQTSPYFIIRLNNCFLGHVRTCFKLEVFHDKKNGIINTIRNIEVMCQNKELKKLINSFNPQYYTVQQRLFSFFLKRQMPRLVYLMCKIQNIRKGIC